MEFGEKRLSATITIVKDNFTRTFDINKDPNAKAQLFIEAQIEMLGMGDGRARIRIFGLSEDTMNKCAIVSLQGSVYIGNTIQLFVNDSILFTGEIIHSVPNYTEFPNLSLDIDCFLEPNGVKNRTSPIMQRLYPPLPYAYSSKSIHDALGYIAMQICGFNKGRDVFEDERAAGHEYQSEGYGLLSRRTSDPLPKRLYLYGSPMEILNDFCNEFGIQYVLRENKNTKGKDLYYFPVGAIIPAESDVKCWYLSAENKNLFGYPNATDNGIQFKCEFNPKMQICDMIDIKTTVPGLSRRYSISKLKGFISTKDGKWEADGEAVRYAAESK